MYEVGLAEVFKQALAALESENLKAAEGLIIPALDQHPEDPQCWFYMASIFFKRDHQALAKMCFEKAAELEPQSSVYSNLGASLRRLNRLGDARIMLEKAVGYNPENSAALTNLAALWVNEGNPAPGIEAAQQAISVHNTADYPRAKWNLGLLQLEQGEFAKGFDNYRAGLGSERVIRSYAPGHATEPEILTLAEHRENVKAKIRPKLIVWGEQGIGDEIMFSQCLHDAKRHYDVIFDCHPRLLSLFERSYPWVELHPTRKDEYIMWPHTMKFDVQYKMPIGDLAMLYRRSRKAWERGWNSYGPYLQGDSDEINWNREILSGLAGSRKRIGIAWTGGVIRTMRQYRSVDLKTLDPIIGRADVMPVSLQYEDPMPAIMDYHKRTGHEVYAFRSATEHYDYDRTAGLVGALDAVITVCQSVAHLSAALGIPTYVLVPDRPAWRYGLKEERWFAYSGDHVHLYRQKPGGSWDEPVGRLIKDVLEEQL